MIRGRAVNASIRSRWPARRRGVIACFVLATGLLVAAPREVATIETMPRIGDHTLLSWREGPPYLTNATALDAKASGYSSARRFLRLATGHFAADFDTEKITLTGFSQRAEPVDETAVVHETLAAAPLLAAELHLEIRVGEVTYRSTGRAPLALSTYGKPTTPLDFPVRVIESGRFFQKFALHDLEFRTADGQRLAADARLEVSAWPDRLALVLVVQPEESLIAARVSLRLEAKAESIGADEAGVATWPQRVEHHTALFITTATTPTAEEIFVRVESADPRGKAIVRWNAEESAPTILLEAPHWPAPKEGNYPESMLDAWESYAVSVENRSAVAQRVGLNFDHTPVKSIIGYVPMVLDSHGLPSGLPVQISKNWHVAPSSAPVPYMGQWMHGRTWLNLPAHSRVSFRYGTTFARWGGVPTASLAQLSLVGWGHNGFWDQLALGAFGESFCFQPGRVMRRALLTDLRPLYQQGMATGERWAWTSNVGGADTMVRLDPAGRYVPFKRNATRYASHGPNLAHAIYDEVSDDDAIRSRTEIFLPRTDDGVRVYLRVRYEVTRRVEFSRLAFFQLGADFYNEVDAPLLAWGDVGGLAAEHRLQPESGARLLPAWEARGEQPWLSLHGETRADSAQIGQASRGLIVRDWRATLGGKKIAAPFFSTVGSRGAKPHLAAEIVPPPDVTALEPGDSVEMLLEFLPIPLAAERYYGPDKSFAAALASGANTWRPVQREAAMNRPVLNVGPGGAVRGWPLEVPATASGEVAFTLQGGLGWVPIRVTGLTNPDAGKLFRVTPAGREAVAQGDATRAFWQSDYDPATLRWTVTYNLPATDQPADYLLLSRETTRAPLTPAAMPALAH